jgi:hypothetical protein
MRAGSDVVDRIFTGTRMRTAMRRRSMMMRAAMGMSMRFPMSFMRVVIRSGSFMRRENGRSIFTESHGRRRRRRSTVDHVVNESTDVAEEAVRRRRGRRHVTFDLIQMLGLELKLLWFAFRKNGWVST